MTTIGSASTMSAPITAPGISTKEWTTRKSKPKSAKTPYGTDQPGPWATDPTTHPFATAETTRAKDQAYHPFAARNGETLNQTNGYYDLKGKTPATGTKTLGPKERKAAQFFQLTQPFNLQQVKQRYKTLVKLHHPDANGGDKQAEETLKTIIEAYRLLRPLCQPE